MGFTTNRRSFLEKLGLGAGAALLSPIATSLVAEAQGKTIPRKIFVVFIHGNGLHHDMNFTPPEFAASSAPVLEGPTAYTWPKMFKAVEPWRNRMLLVDGLPNRPRSGASQHGGGYSALSCFAALNGGSNEGGGRPGHISIDQFIANGIGKSSRSRSILFGASQNRAAVRARAFSRGPGNPEPHFQDPGLMFNDLYGSLVTDPTGFARGATKQRILLDGMRADVKRLEQALAGPERAKLAHYLTAVENAESTLAASMSLDCKPPTVPIDETSVESRLEAMNEMATLALVCGMTNVVGVSVGVGNSHTEFPKYTRVHLGTQFEKDGGIDSHGHSVDSIQGPAWDILHTFNLGLVARTIQALSAVKSGGRTLFDDTTMLYLSDNGSYHHSKQERHPLAIIGDAGGALKTGGRFLRYPPAAKGKPPARSLADLYCSLATACGVPTSTFGKGGNEPVTGPLPELMA